MTILEDTSKSAEPHEATTSSRSFFDLKEHIDLIMQLADASKKAPIYSEARHAQLHTAAATLQDFLTSHRGWLAFKAESLAPKPGSILDEYTVEPGAVIIPTRRITAYDVNPQTYGEDRDAMPVINLRVQSNNDDIGWRVRERWFTLLLSGTQVVLGREQSTSE